MPAPRRHELSFFSVVAVLVAACSACASTQDEPAQGEPTQSDESDFSSPGVECETPEVKQLEADACKDGYKILTACHMRPEDGNSCVQTCYVTAVQGPCFQNCIAEKCACVESRYDFERYQTAKKQLRALGCLKAGAIRCIPHYRSDLLGDLCSYY